MPELIYANEIFTVVIYLAAAKNIIKHRISKLIYVGTQVNKISQSNSSFHFHLPSVIIIVACIARIKFHPSWNRKRKCQLTSNTHVDRREELRSLSFQENDHLFVIGYFAENDLLVVMNFNDIYELTQV